MPEEQTNETASTNTPELSTTKSKAVSGPGSRLRNAREARNMGVEQVAAQLRLDGNVIRAMEDDDFAALPSATFVKGYLRSYGRMLALDVEVLVAEYQAAAGAEEVQLRVPEKPPADGSLINKWFWLVLVLVSVLLLAWYWSKPGDQPVSTDTLTSDSSLVAPAETATEAAPALGATAAFSEDESADATANDPVIEQLLQGLQDPVAPVAEQAAETAEAAPAVEAAANEPVVSESETPAASQEVLASELVTVTLVGLQDSWVSIKDARDKRVYRDMLKPGERREISGAAPLLVHLGYAPGVKVLVSGQEYDHSVWHKANSTARFTLPN